MTPEERLELLEREVVKMRGALGELYRRRPPGRVLVTLLSLAALVMSGLAFLSVGGLAADMSLRDTIDVRRLNIVDDRGRTRATLSAVEDGAMFVLFDHGGNKRVELVSSVAGSGLAILDRSGQRRAGLAETSHDGPMMMLSYPNGRPAALMTLRDSEPTLGLFDLAHNRRIAVGATKRGPMVILYDHVGGERIGLGHTSETGPRVSVLEGDGTTVWTVP